MPTKVKRPEDHPNFEQGNDYVAPPLKEQPVLFPMGKKYHFAKKRRVRPEYMENSAAMQMHHLENHGTLIENKGAWMNRILIGHPVTGNVRIEWVMGRYGQTIPCNWSHIDILQFMSPYVPLKYQVADAENLIAKAVIEQNAEWLLMWEHDNIPTTNDALIKINQYMIDAKDPVVAGVYFTKSVPPEPLVYRGIGNSYFADWKLGDKVWCSGVPFGFTLIHGSLIRAMWDESPEYIASGTITRRVFDAPSKSWMDQASGAYLSTGGTSDLAWCERVVKGNYFAKAGWPKHQKMKYPFLIDTGIFLTHIDQYGTRFPIEIPKRFKPNGKVREIR